MNDECPICFELIDSKDIEGLICLTCNHIYCFNCSQNINKYKCSICRQKFNLKNDEELFSLINITLEKNKKDYLHLGIIYCKVAKEYLNYNLNYAVSLYKEAQKLNIKIPVLLIANKYYENKDYENSLLWYQTKPEDKFSCQRMAIIYLYLNNEELAIKWFYEAFKLGDIKSLSSIGCLYYKKKEYSKAKKYFQLGADKNDVYSINNLAIYYKIIENNNKIFMKLLNPLKKINYLAMYNLSLEHFRLGNKNTAIKLLKSSAKLNYNKAVELLREIENNKKIKSSIV